MHQLDKRLNVVLEKLTDRLSKCQSLSIRKVSTSRNEEIQFGRFIGNDKVTVERLTTVLYSKMRHHVSSAHCLLIEDTMVLPNCWTDLGLN